MTHQSITAELIGTIQEERRLQAARRREIARRVVRNERPQEEVMRMALGPGIQFGGVTEHVLDTVTNRRLRKTAA
jgi:hypothetical protein